MKNSLIVLWFLVGTSAFAAKECHVYGISNSPQALTCQFKQGVDQLTLKLVCIEGVYSLRSYLNDVGVGQKVVTQAYHEDVQSGSSPLVFESKAGTLVAIAKTRTAGYTGRWIVGKSAANGLCK